MPYNTGRLGNTQPVLRTSDGHQAVVYQNVVRLHVLSCVLLHSKAGQFIVYYGAHFVYQLLPINTAQYVQQKYVRLPVSPQFYKPPVRIQLC